MLIVCRLMHETYQTTIQTLTPWLINWAKTNNLKLVTVGECLGCLPGVPRPRSANSSQPSVSEIPEACTRQGTLPATARASVEWEEHVGRVKPRPMPSMVYGERNAYKPKQPVVE